MGAKQKTHSGSAKRFRVTGSGKIKRKKANRSHILSKMSTKRKRGLRASGMVSAADEVLIHRLFKRLKKRKS